MFLPDGKRVGELDEEMVYESRVGETFLLGASTWRIEAIDFDRVVVTPAPGQPGKMPFWHGDRPGRPLELGRAVGAFTREIVEQLQDSDGPPGTLPRGARAPRPRLRDEHALDELAATNLLLFLADQRAATGVVPDDRTVVVERFRDEIGDWRVCVLSPFGARVHAPWAMALRATLEERYGEPVETLWSDDGIVLRLPEAEDAVPLDALLLDPDVVDDVVVGHLPGTALFAARFREAAGRALLLPRRRPDRRTPLWQQRQRAANLLQVAARYPSFPILLEASRECLQEVFDLPALREVLGQLRSRRIRLVPVDTDRASPMAQSLLFSWIAVYMYEGDAPLAERRATALSLDRDLLRDLLGAEELRELIDPGVLADLELQLQRLGDTRPARDADEVHDLLRLLGDLTVEELAARSSVDPAPVVRELVEARRAIEVGVSGETRFAAAEDAARYRDGLGCALPVGLPAAFTEPVARPLDELVARYARTHGPFLAREVASRFGLAGRPGPGGPRPASRPTAGWCEASSAPTARSGSGATSRCCASSGAGRWPRSAARSSPSAPTRSLASSPRGTASTVPGRGHDAAVAGRRPTAGRSPARLGAGDRPAARPGSGTSPPPTSTPSWPVGDLVWIGAGSLGSNDGRVTLLFRAPGGSAGRRGGRRAARRAAPRRPAHRARATGRAVLARPVRCLRQRHHRRRGAHRAVGPRLVGRGHQRHPGPAAGALGDRIEPPPDHRTGPTPTRSAARHRPAVGGRAGGRSPRRCSMPAPSATEAAHLRASVLIERHGVLTREAVLAEGVRGGFAGVYPVLRALEEPRPGPPGLLRGRPRRRPVRLARRHRPAP